MKKKALTVLMYALLLMAAFVGGRGLAMYFGPQALRQVIDTRHGSIIRLVSEGRTFCSGTVISDDLIITAAHCVLMETPIGLMSRGAIEIRPSDNQKTGDSGAVIYATPQMDQAMLHGDFKNYKPRAFTTDPEKLSNIRLKHTKFISCGFPLNGDLYCNETTFDKPSDFYWDINGVLIPGMSGGPTFLTDGTLVAVNTINNIPLFKVIPVRMVLGECHYRSCYRYVLFWIP